MPERMLRAFAGHPYRYAALSLFACALAAYAGYGSGIEGLQAVTRYTGRAGLLWFSILFVLAAEHRYADTNRARQALAIVRGFAVHHAVHLVLLLSYLEASGHPLVVSRAAGGMLGYVLLFAMAAASTDTARRRIGSTRWKALHQLGLWYLWIVFVLTYLPRLEGKLPDAGGGPKEFAACMLLLVVLAAFRVAAMLPRTSTAGTVS